MKKSDWYIWIHISILLLSISWLVSYLDDNPLTNIIYENIIITFYITWFAVFATQIDYDMYMHFRKSNEKYKINKFVVWITTTIIIMFWELRTLYHYLIDNHVSYYDESYPIIGSTAEWFVFPLLITACVMNGFVFLFILYHFKKEDEK